MFTRHLTVIKTPISKNNRMWLLFTFFHQVYLWIQRETYTGIWEFTQSTALRHKLMILLSNAQTDGAQTAQIFPYCEISGFENAILNVQIVCFCAC